MYTKNEGGSKRTIMISFKLAYLGAVILLVPAVLGKRDGQICDKLSKNPWLPYDVSLVDKVPGIYVIGEKKGSETKYLYAGRSDDVRRRLQEHRIQKQQDIDKRVAGKFKKHKETDLRMKYVSERRQKSKEGEYMQCLKKKIGYRPELNKREGDGCASCVARQKKSHAKRSAKHSSSRSSPRSPARPKVASPGRSASSSKILSKRSSRTSSGSKISPGPSFRSSGRPKVSKRLSFRSSGSTKVSSGRSTFRSSGTPKVSSGRSSFKPHGTPKSSPGGSSFRSSGRSSFRSSSRRK